MSYLPAPPLPDLLTQHISRRSVISTSLLVSAVAVWRRTRGMGAQAAVPTRFVAAADATATEKAAADYRCDGTDDHLEIRAALRSLPKTGGAAIRLSSGHFNLGEGNVTFTEYANLAVEGAGIDRTFVANATALAYDSEPLSYTRCPGAVVRDMTISAGGSARSSSDALDFDDSNDCLVERVKIVASRGRGIVFDGKDIRKDGTPAQSLRNVVRDCQVNGCPGAGIQLLAAEQCLIINCTVTGNQSNGLWMQRSSTYGRRCFDNAVRGGTYAGNSSSGILITEGDRNIVDGAVCRNNGSDGVRIQTSSGTGFSANGNQIVNCICTDTQATKTQDYGVNLYGAPETDIDGTVIRDNDLRGNRVGPYKTIAVNTVVSGNTGDATATPTPTPTKTATATPGSGIFSDGFESGTLGAWSSSNGLVVQQSQRASGTYAARGTSSGTTAYARRTLAAAQTNLYFSTKVRLNSKDSTTLYLMRLRTGGNTSIMGVYVSSTGRLGYRNDVGAVSRTSTTSLALGQWHTLELHVAINGAASLVEVWLNGQRIDALSRSENLGTGGVGVLQIGENSSGRTFDVVFDDVKADTMCIGSCPVGSSEEPTATSTPEATTTSTAKPTNTPQATGTAEASSTPPPTRTSTPAPTSTSVPPTSTPQATSTPPSPTSTPRPLSFSFQVLSPVPPPSGGTVEIAVTLTGGTVPVRVNLRSTKVAVAVETPDWTTFNAVGEQQIVRLTDQTGSSDPGGSVRLQTVVNNTVVGQSEAISFPAG